MKVIVKTYLEGYSENLQPKLKSRKIRSTFYTERTLRKLLCKPKVRVATENENNIVYENSCNNCKAVYFGESKRSLKLHSDEHKRSVRITIVIRAKLQNTVEKQVTDLVGIRRKLLIGKAD